MSATWSDDESEGEHDDEATNHVMAFVRKCESFDELCDDDLSYEELNDSYKQLYVKCEEICEVGKRPKKIIANLRLDKEKLISIISGLQDEVTFLTSKLDNIT